MVNSRWAIVHRNGFINHAWLKYTRRDVIAEYLAEYAGFRERRHPGLSDAQFWRLMKRKRGFSVRRVVIKVVR